MLMYIIHQVLLDIGNINTLACINERSGSWSKTRTASWLRSDGRWVSFELGRELTFLDSNCSSIGVLLLFSGHKNAGLGLRSSFSKPKKKKKIIYTIMVTHADTHNILKNNNIYKIRME